MVPYSFDGGDHDWYRALDTYSFPPLLCSLSPPPLVSSKEGNLLNTAVAPPSLRSSNNLWGSGHGSLQLAASDSSSSAIILWDEDSYHLPMFPAPAPDPFFFDRLPPILPPAKGTTAGLDVDDLMMQPFSDIDLDAFSTDGDENKQAALVVPPPLADNKTVVAAADQLCAASPDAVVIDDAHIDQKKPVATADYVYRREDRIVAGNYMADNVGQQGERHQQACSVAAALPPPVLPRPQVVRRAVVEQSAPAPPAAAAAGKTRLEPLDHIGFDEIRKYFYMPITKAAREMNMGLTVLKKRCRELGVARWPHRKMKSLRSLMLNVQKMSKGMSPAAVQRELAALETYCMLMEEDPSIELTERTKKLRQACFKESYKRRRAASIASGVVHHDDKFGHGHHHQFALQEASSGSGAAAGRDLQSGHFFSY